MSTYSGTTAAVQTTAEWVHLAYPEVSRVAEVYGFSGSQGMVNLEGVRFMPKDGPGRDSKTLLVFMHPATTLQLLPVPRALAARGAHVLCAGSRYAKNDAPLIFEKVLLDLGAYMRHAREVWKYEKIVLVGWSGGGSLSLFYQSQAERPTITQTPAGDPVDIKAAGLIPADGVVFHAAHLSRAITLTDFVDPSVLDEDNPERRKLELDIYDPRNPNQPPYSDDFIEHYRGAQRERMRRRTAWVKEKLAQLRATPGEAERAFVTHRTMADLRFLDPRIDPNDRRPGWSYLGEPRLANTAPAGPGRFSTLRSWLSQWSMDDTRALGVPCARDIGVPLLCIENTADDAVPRPDTHLVHEAAGSSDKVFHAIKGATHYYQGQPELLAEAVDTTLAWLAQRGMAL